MTLLAPSKPAATPLPDPSPTEHNADQPFLPLAPSTFHEAGLDPGTVESLILKHLATVGSAAGGEIAKELCLPTKPIIDYLSMLKQQQIVVYIGSAHLGDFTYTLTDAGRDRAARFMAESMYVGPAPVPLDAYVASVAAQTITTMQPKESDLRAAFSDLLITQEMFNVLGPAINSGRGMFLYGAPGNGKTSIAERITRCFGDTVYIPRCLIVDGLIINLFDAANQEEIVGRQDSIFKRNQLDERWVKIRRPTIVSGGELTMNLLEVQYNPINKTCEAPLQMKSNCGTLLIDDFGRQRMAPIELLNRWIVPLERRYDFLTLPTGKKVRVPFDQLIIFSTNLEPRDLCDEAFLRRIPYKINVSDPNQDQFSKLFEFVGPRMGFTMDADALAAVAYLIETHYTKAGRPFRYCQPRDLALQVRNRCLYLGQPLKLTPELFDYAVSAYFTVM